MRRINFEFHKSRMRFKGEIHAESEKKFGDWG